MNPRPMKKAMTMSQTLPLPKPLKASFRLKALVAASTVMAVKTRAPRGMGFMRNPKMVLTNTAKTFQPLGLTPAGQGMNHRTRNKANT